MPRATTTAFILAWRKKFEIISSNIMMFQIRTNISTGRGLVPEGVQQFTPAGKLHVGRISMNPKIGIVHYSGSTCAAAAR